MNSIRLPALAATLAALSLQAPAQTTFQSIPTPGPWASLLDVSPDGSAIVVGDGTGLHLWTTTNPTWTLVYSGSAYSAEVANNGTHVASTLPDPGNGNLETAARWSATTGQWTFLPGLGATSGSSLSSTYDISADGSVVVGLGWISANIAHAFRWDAVNGTVDLGSFGGGSASSRPNCVSADGTTAAGWDSDPVTGAWRAARWSSAGEQLLGCLDPADPINGWSEAYAISSNGQFVVGESSTGLSTPSGWGEQHLFRWDPVNGIIDRGTCNVDPNGWGTHLTIPTGVSDDGRIVVGNAGTGGPFGARRPFISREGSPMLTLQDDLLALGLPQASTWLFDEVGGLSGDGRIVTGMAYDPSFTSFVFRVTYPALAETYCTAKVNSQGCTPSIQASGVASVTALAPFNVDATQVINKKNGLLFYGFAAASFPFQGGTNCVQPPTVRTPQQFSGGTAVGDDCSGSYSFDFNAEIQRGVIPGLVSGAKVYAQYWYRDPQSPSTTGLTNGASFTIFP